jgi:hypothetical protein
LMVASDHMFLRVGWAVENLVVSRIISLGFRWVLDLLLSWFQWGQLGLQASCA